MAVIERPPPTGEGLTYEKVWAMFQETDRKMQETDRLIKENAESQKETDRKMQETSRKMEETGRFLTKIGRQVGGLNRRFGQMAQHLVAPGIAKRFNEQGFHFDSIARGGMTILDEQGEPKAEIDLLLENGEYIIAVEVKATVRLKDVEHHVKRLEILREYRQKKQDKPKKIQGAIAGAIFGQEEKQAVIEAGFYALEQSGDTMKMVIPGDFVPREF